MVSQHGILHVNVMGERDRPRDLELDELTSRGGRAKPPWNSGDHLHRPSPCLCRQSRNRDERGRFLQWPEPIGFGAIGDPAVVAEFADIARQEYRAVGIHLALHPMADLATEPRWGRIHGTFGEDAALASRLTAAYVRGFQGEGARS